MLIIMLKAPIIIFKTSFKYTRINYLRHFVLVSRIITADTHHKNNIFLNIFLKTL